MSADRLERLLTGMEELDKEVNEYVSVLDKKLKIYDALITGGATAAEDLLTNWLAPHETTINTRFNPTSQGKSVHQTTGLFHVPRYVNNLLQLGVNFATITNIIYDYDSYKQGEISKGTFIKKTLKHGSIAVGSKIASWLSSRFTKTESKVTGFQEGRIIETNYAIPSLISLGALIVEGGMLINNSGTKDFKEVERISKLEGLIRRGYESGLKTLGTITDISTGPLMVDMDGDGVFDTEYDNCSNDFKKLVGGLLVNAYPELKNTKSSDFKLNEVLTNPHVKGIYETLFDGEGLDVNTDKKFYNHYVRSVFNDNPADINVSTATAEYNHEELNPRLSLKADSLCSEIESLGISYEQALESIKKYLGV